MKRIKIPDPIPVQDAITGELVEGEPAVDFFRWSCQNIGRDARFGDGGAETLASWIKIREAIRNAKPGDVVEIEDADYKLAKEAAENPQRRVNGPMGPQVLKGYGDALIAALFMPFIEAWTKELPPKSELLP